MGGGAFKMWWHHPQGLMDFSGREWLESKSWCSVFSSHALHLMHLLACASFFPSMHETVQATSNAFKIINRSNLFLSLATSLKHSVLARARGYADANVKNSNTVNCKRDGTLNNRKRTSSESNRLELQSQNHSLPAVGVCTWSLPSMSANYCSLVRRP